MPPEARIMLDLGQIGKTACSEERRAMLPSPSYFRVLFRPKCRRFNRSSLLRRPASPFRPNTPAQGFFPDKAGSFCSAHLVVKCKERRSSALIHASRLL
jgi:hypothetical protein